MALQAVVYQQGLFDLKNDPNKDFYSLLENWSWAFNLPIPDQDFTQQLDLDLDLVNDQTPWELQISPLSSMAPSFSNELATPTPTSNSPEPEPEPEPEPDVRTTSSTRPKRRRSTRSTKNKEEIESQRMTHIAVERNRRKQMNEYLSMLKSLMPESYIQRSDQASIVGAAINFVKELEQNLQSLRAQKASPFAAEFFSFPQYSTMADSGGEAKRSTVADVEVSMVEGHANLKIRTRKHPKQLLKLVTGLQNLRLNILHLNVNTSDQFCLYSFNLKVEDESKLNSVEEVATAVHQLLIRIQDPFS